MNFQTIHQALSAWQAESKTLSAGVPVFEGSRNVGDPGTVVVCAHDEGNSTIVLLDGEVDLPTGRVTGDVSSDFRCLLYTSDAADE